MSNKSKRKQGNDNVEGDTTGENISEPVISDGANKHINNLEHVVNVLAEG